MAPHSSTLAWKIPWMEDPGGPRSMGLLRVGHDWATLLSLFTFMHWRRKWQPTPVFLPGESQGRGSLVGCHLWGCRVGHDWSDLAASSSSSKARSASDLSLVLEVIQSQLHKNPSSTTTPSSCLKSLQRNYSRYFLWFPLKKIKLRYDGTNSKDIYWLQRIFSFSA